MTASTRLRIHLLLFLLLSPLAAAAKAQSAPYSWGGNGELQVTNTPTVANFTKIKCGTKYVLALRADGTLSSWGPNGSALVTSTPPPPIYKDVAVGTSHCLVQRLDPS